MKKLRKYHKWPSLIVGLFILLFCVSGIIMNHRSIFASFDFPRFLMPGDYHYKNWNLASVKGFLPLNDSSVLAYGNVGIWKTDKHLSAFSDFNQGFPKGIDHRKTFTMVQTNDNRLFAGTLFGLFEFDHQESRWVEIILPSGSPRIVKLLEKGTNLIILTRSEMYEMPLAPNKGLQAKSEITGKQAFQTIHIPAPANHDGKVGMFRTLWVVHSGEIFGLTGKLLVDLVGLAVIFMTLTGFFYTFLPKFVKKLRDNLKKKFQKTNRKLINWHTLIGVYGIPILLITVITGMFLRPPLLIPIANKQVAAIPGTLLAHENVWHDKLRDVVFDTTLNAYIISTSEGFIEYSNKDGREKVRLIQSQPPVSVMGINAFEQLNNHEYLVASFSGIYRWNTQDGTSIDMITGMPVVGQSGGNPFGAVAVAGVYMKDNTLMAILDYGSGWISMKPHNKPDMPDIISHQPISWWNLALEVHTGRIFAFLFGNFYILYVPLMGITVLVILITGFLMYWKSNKRKKKSMVKRTEISTVNDGA
jgi:hypothetical protein